MTDNNTPGFHIGWVLDDTRPKKSLTKVKCLACNTEETMSHERFNEIAPRFRCSNSACGQPLHPPQETH